MDVLGQGFNMRLIFICLNLTVSLNLNLSNFNDFNKFENSTLLIILKIQKITIYFQRTYSSMIFHKANAVRSSTSLPSIMMRSHILSTQSIGTQLQNSVRNHCIVNTLINGGSTEGSFVEYCNFCKCLANFGNLFPNSSLNTAMST
jgi:hypothetical protein